MDSRYMQALLPSTDKVSYVELHPTLPWLACFDRNDYLTVWDWHKHEVVMECQLGSNTQLNRQEVELHSRTEADVNFFGRPLSEYVARNYTIGQATGKIRSLAFIDLDTIYWKASMQTLFSQGPAATSPSVSHLGYLADARHLMIVAERAVILMDLLSKRVKTIPSQNAALGGKSFYDAAFLLRDVTGAVLASPMVAIACSDNAVRVVDALRLTVHHVLVSGFTAPVSCMLVIPCPNAGGDWLIVGDEKGNVVVWRPLSAVETTPPVLVLSHKEAVISMLYIPWVDEAGSSAPRLAIVTTDNRITTYDVKSMKMLYRVKVLEKIKAKVTGACVAASGVANDRSVNSIVVSTNVPVVFALSPEDCRVPHIVVNLETSLPARTDKKEAKLYHIASHPLRPDVVAAATNAGVAILRTQPQRSFPICGLNAVLSFKVVEAPSEDMLIAPNSPTGVDEPEESKARSVSFVTASNGKLEGVTFKAQPEDGAAMDRVGRRIATKDRAGVNEPPLNILLASRCVIGAIEDGRADVKANAAGNLVAVCWHSTAERAAALKGAAQSVATDAGRYRVFRLVSEEGRGVEWVCVDEGQATQVEWHTEHDWLAVLVVPKPPAELPITSGKNKAATKEAAMEAALREAAAARAAALAASVTVREFTPMGAVQQRLRIGSTPESAIVGLHGGTLLGVVRSPLTGPNSVASNRMLHMYDWEMGLTTGIELPEPKFASFAPSGEYAALAYSEGIDIYTLDESFRHLTRLGVRDATSAVWHESQLFTTTDGSLFVTFVVPPAEADSSLTRTTNLFAQTGGDGLPELSSVPPASTTKLTTIELATLAVGSSRDFKKAGVPARTELPPLSIRPGNGAKLLRATDSTVWLVSCHGHPCAISLQHPGVKCRQLASAGDLKGARKLAVAALDPRFHNGVALFFSAFGQDGCAEALLLPGLTLELELALSIKCGALKRGWACLASLLAGCKDSTLLCRFAAWNNRDVDPSKLEDDRPEDALADPFAAAAPALEQLGKGLNNAEIENVLAVFTKAAGVTAPHILARLIPTGVQGRKTALDEAFFSSAPEGDSPKAVAKVKAPPPSTKYKPMFPRAPADKPNEFELETLPEGNEYVDVIDWDLPLRKPEPEAKAAESDAAASPDEPAADGEEGGDDEAESARVDEQTAAPIGANTAPDARVLELGIQLLDASVNYADVHMLQQTIRLMAPHTGIMTPAQQQRMVAAVGACGLASHLSDLTLSGTTPLMPVTALLAGFLSGDAIVASRVLEKEGLLPLKALFMQSCGAGGLEATVEWEGHLRGLLGGPTRQLTITPTTS